jgi:hypothetical protein
VTDLRDQLADFETAARRLLNTRRPLVLVHDRPANCHPDRPVVARNLCRPCYDHAWSEGTLGQHPTKHRSRRRLEEFVDMWELLRPEGATLLTVADRLGMTRGAASQAHHRAVRRGLLTPDRRIA